MLDYISVALADIRVGLAKWRIWSTLAFEDISDQHRRTTIGPLWVMFNYLALAGTFIFVFQRGAESAEGAVDYVAYVAVGLFAWFYMMEVINAAVTLFVREANFIKGTTLPVSAYVFRLFMQALIRGGYTLIGCAIMLAFSDVQWSTQMLLSLAGIAVLLLATPPAIITFALAGVFVPDSQFIVSNVMRVGMFITPVFWVFSPREEGLRQLIYYWNPFTYFLEIVRAPISGEVDPGYFFLVCGGVTLLLWGVALIALGRLRNDLVFEL